MKATSLVIALLLSACGGIASIIPTVADVMAFNATLSQRDWQCHPDSAVKPARCYAQRNEQTTQEEK